MDVIVGTRTSDRVLTCPRIFEQISARVILRVQMARHVSPSRRRCQHPQHQYCLLQPIPSRLQRPTSEQKMTDCSHLENQKLLYHKGAHLIDPDGFNMMQKYERTRPRTGTASTSVTQYNDYAVSAEQMKSLLRAAGLHEDVVTMIDQVVSTCRIRRRSQQSSPKSQTTVRPSEHFNECVQMDLLFYMDSDDSKYNILHLIDEAIRWGGGGLVESRECVDIIDGLCHYWFITFGQPATFIADQEGGISFMDGQQFLRRHDVALKLRPLGAKAWIVGRHNALLRKVLHKISDQFKEESLDVPMKHRLAEAIFIKSVMCQFNGYSPYAFTGRQPRLLPSSEETDVGVIYDATGPAPGRSRSTVRLREIAIEAIVSSTAQQRIARAAATRTLLAAELHEYAVGNLVDYWRKQDNKDDSAWFGLATVCVTSPG